MSAMEAWSEIQAAQEISEQVIPRLDEWQQLPEERANDEKLIVEFNKIAAGMIKGSPGIEMPGSSQPIPWDPPHANQAVLLFCEGVYFALQRCHEMRITGNIKIELMQNLAMDVYGQAIQVVASTYGQELTPEYQFTHQQQVEFIQKGAESVLLLYINEYERKNGPIVSEEDIAEAEALIAEENWEDAPEAPPLPEEVSAEMPAAPVAPARPKPAKKPAAPAKAKPKGPGPHDKYAAVALLLTTLKPERRKKIIQNFNQDERELISYYSYPQHIEQNLDLTSVSKHLRQFKEMMQQGGSSLKSNAYRGISQLVKSNSLEKLLSYVKDERPKVQEYLAMHYEPEDTLHPTEGSPSAPEQRHFSDLLPPRVEDILYRHLNKRLSSEGSPKSA